MSADAAGPERAARGPVAPDDEPSRSNGYDLPAYPPWRRRPDLRRGPAPLPRRPPGLRRRHQGRGTRVLVRRPDHRRHPGGGRDLDNARTITVLAPTDGAFAEIPKADLDKVLADQAEPTEILTHHVVGRKVTANATVYVVDTVLMPR